MYRRGYVVVQYSDLSFVSSGLLVRLLGGYGALLKRDYDAASTSFCCLMQRRSQAISIMGELNGKTEAVLTSLT